MTRRPTFSELAWPDDHGDAELAVRWAHGVSNQILGWTWRAFDALRSKSLSRIDLTQPLEQLERDLVRHHFLEIQLLYAAETDGYASFVPHHEWPEMESRSSAGAKPPANDMAFVATSNQRWAWAVEAKVVPSPNSLGEYLKDVHEKFVAGIASPLVGEGSMLGYLLCRDASAVFEALEKRLGQKLEQVVEFERHPHKASRHRRISPPALRLHHMLMVCVV